ncbi:MAG TPA: polysaccharide biosynthesis/export family protein [Candidatus Barnesiella excrementipullorum]|uniref:Polysaccharide biosynthesis/export family protein n=1 Tax=Candidatus Barnesiella excrementipullorum TaxID=2838479 RepID=A0A9D1VQJ0_9BACT|nr:polysaccharide biosynthesis/export family protein [Candidatus Barnesiella excrementipullorum]
MKKILILSSVLLLLASCQSAKQVPYLQNVDEIPADVLAKATYVPEQILMPGDLLDITVMATDRVSVQPFNRRVVDLSKSSGSLTSDELNFYLVDNSGYIDMPVLGRIYVQGMTKSELENYIREEIYPKYIHEVPAVTVRFENFRISVTGDVAKPGSFVVPNERINVLEAIAMAGDLNITGRRDNVLLVRVNADGSRTTARLDLTDKDLILSPYFYLQQNDVLYVEPNVSKARSSTVVPPTASLAISIIGSALSVASLIMTILNFTNITK